MRITLKSGKHWTFRIVAETGEVVRIEMDWDFPSAAGVFGWEANGVSGKAMLWDAYEFLERQIGNTVEDAGYFFPQVFAPVSAGAAF